MDEGAYLHIDLMIQILLWLPPKSLIRLRSVCKLWFSTIGDPKFIEEHLSQLDNSKHKNRSDLMIFPTFEEPNFKIFVLPDNTAGKLFNNNVLTHVKRRDYLITGSCNGILTSIYVHPRSPCQRFILLSNPSIRRTISVPDCPLFKDTDGHWRVEDYRCGIGFDSVKNDYKVVMIRVEEISVQQAKVAIFSLNLMSWKRVDSQVLHMHPIGKSVFLHGFIHWFCPVDLSIILFDVSNEVFSRMKLPELQRGEPFLEDEDCHAIYVVNGSLCVVDMSQQWDEGFLDVWIMEEYGVVESWAKLFRVKQECADIGLLTTGGKMIMCCDDGGVVEDGKLVHENEYPCGLYDVPYNQVILYDPKTHEFTNLYRTVNIIPDEMVCVPASIELLNYQV